MALRDQVVDIFLTGPDQLPPDHQGGQGRLTDLRNATIEHFDPATPAKPQFLNIKQRKGMRSLALTGHNIATGVATTPAWTGPRLLATTQSGAPCSICRSKPRVYDGTDWADYPDTRVVTNKTTARPIWSGQSVAQAPDKAWLNGVICHAWTEVTNGANISSTSTANVLVGFKADNGAWIRTPFALPVDIDPGLANMARVVHDGTHFWVFTNDHAAAGPHPRIRGFAFTTDGLLLGSNGVDMKWEVFEPGYWDVQRRSSVILLVQPNGTDPGADNHVIVSEFSWTGAVVSIVDYPIVGVHCNGPVAWATNFQDSFNYLLTTNFVSGTVSRYYGYRIEFVIPDGYDATHEYDYNVSSPVVPDTLIGFTETSTDSTPAHKNLVISFGLPAQASAYGAAYDPALRYMQSWRKPWTGSTTFIRQTNGLAQVSRAFVIDDDYYAMTYYQSGSGEAEAEVIDVDIFESGDFFVGAPEQPLVVSGTSTTTTGSPEPFAGAYVYTTSTVANQNILGGDTLLNTTAPAGLTVPVGTAVIKWTFANGYPGPTTGNGGRLKLTGNTDQPAVNVGSWEIVGLGGGGIIYTMPVSTASGTVVDQTFTASGQYKLDSMTKYNVDLASEYNVPALYTNLPNGTIVVSGSSVTGANGTFTIAYGRPDGVWVATTTQSVVGLSVDNFSTIVTPAFPNRWGLPGNLLDDSYDGAFLRVAGAAKGANNGDFEITGSANSQSLDTGNETTLLPEYLPGSAEISVVLAPGDQPYRFNLQDVTFDYSFINAIISWSNPQHPDNAGLYKITQVLGPNTVLTVPVSTLGTPRNEFIIDPPSSISILKQAATAPQIQPQWFITPLGDVTTSQVGNLELGLAYADWRREAAAATIGAENPYLLHVSTPCVDNDGYTIDLPFRAVTVTEQSATVIGGQVSTSAIAAAVVGVKEFKVYSAVFGQVNDNLIPGTMAATYDAGSFVEADILIGPEQPTLESQATASTNPALKPGGVYSYVACWEAIDGTGNRIWTAPSPALEVRLADDNDSVVISGRLPIPLGSNGLNKAPDKHYGLSNRPMIVLSIYRTCIQNGLQTTAHYKITDDLAPNAISPISSSNDSGFAFPDEFTWTYKDENLDSVVLSNEQLYTDRGFLPRFHPPAFHNGATGWQERDWLNAYDGAIWFSGQPSEGEAVWYNPLFRVPAPFEPTAVANLSSFLAGFALDSKWYLPQFRPPSNSGQLTNIPAWIRLDLEGGCTGLTLPVRGGVAYSSNFGGVWYLSSQLKDEWTSRDMIDSLDGRTVTALAVDSKQRLYVLTNTTDMFSFDQISRRWSRWLIGSATNIKLATISNGTLHIQNNACVSYYDTTLARDIIAGVETGCPLGFTMASLNFGNVAGVKKVRLFQLRGQYKDTHKLQVTVGYPDQNATSPTTTMQLFTPSSTKPYVLDFYPKTEEASSYSLVVDASFSGVTTPGNSFELDMLAAQVAVDGRAGINKSTQQISNG